VWGSSKFVETKAGRCAWFFSSSLEADAGLTAWRRCLCECFERREGTAGKSIVDSELHNPSSRRRLHSRADQWTTIMACYI